MLEDLASKGHGMDVNGSERRRQKRNPSIAYPLDQPAVHLPPSLSSASFSFPWLLLLFSWPLVPLPFRCLNPHRYLDGRTKAANRKPNNLGHFWQTMPSKCNSNALTHSLGHPRLEFQVANPADAFLRDPCPPRRSSYSDFLLVRSFRLHPSRYPFLPFSFSLYLTVFYAISSWLVFTRARFDKRTWLLHALLSISSCW